MAATTPLGALLRGLVAGAVGSYTQELFFTATSRITPAPPADAFTPPEPAQQGETATATVARRFAEGLMLRAPLRGELKQRGAKVVHYTFGALWGGLYGLARETFPVASGPVGAATFATVVWAVSDNLILPAFKLASWPQAYPPKTHAYAWAAHLAYGAGVWGAYEAMKQAPWVAVAALELWASRGRLWRAAGKRAREISKPARRAVASRTLRQPVRRAASAVARLAP